MKQDCRRIAKAVIRFFQALTLQCFNADRCVAGENSFTSVEHRIAIQQGFKVIADLIYTVLNAILFPTLLKFLNSHSIIPPFC